MKVTKTQNQPAFQPIELKITIESAEELRVLKTLTEEANNNAYLLYHSGNIPYSRRELLASMFKHIYESL